MTIIYRDQRDDGDGVTVESTELPNIIGWGETPTEAMIDLVEQTVAVLSAVVDNVTYLDTMREDV